MITDIENIHNISTLFRESRIYWHREFKIGFLNEVFVLSFDLLSVQISDQEIPMKYPNEQLHVIRFSDFLRGAVLLAAVHLDFNLDPWKPVTHRAVGDIQAPTWYTRYYYYFSVVQSIIRLLFFYDRATTSVENLTNGTCSVFFLFFF